MLVPIPSLVSTLLKMEMENQKGEPLSKVEVLEIRDNCTCINMTEKQYQELCHERGYSDICPESCWDDWQIIKQLY